MASVSNDKNGTRRVSFIDVDGCRRAIYLGKTTHDDAKMVARHVEHLLNSKLTSGAIPAETASWLINISEKLMAKLVRSGLMDKHKPDISRLSNIDIKGQPPHEDEFDTHAITSEAIIEAINKLGDFIRKQLDSLPEMVANAIKDQSESQQIEQDWKTES